MRGLRPTFHGSDAEVSPKVVSLDTTIPDEAASFFNRLYPGSQLAPVPGLPFRWETKAASLSGITLVHSRWSGKARASAEPLEGYYVLTAAEVRSSKLRIEKRSVPLSPGRSCAILSPECPVCMEMDEGYEATTLIVERSRLEAHLTALTGRQVRQLIVFEPAIDLRERNGASISTLTKVLFNLVDPAGPSPLLLANLRDTLFTALLTGLPHSASRLLESPQGGIAPASVRRAEAYMSAHAGEPVTLAEIAAEAGVPARSLQLAFQRFRGYSPLAFLRDRRMEIARQRLFAATPGATVTSVAESLGFGKSVGRFSIQYRQRFGESPSETLSRAVTTKRGGC